MAMLRRSVDLDVAETRRHDVAIRVPCKKMKKRRELDALVAKSQKSLSAVYKGGGYPPGPHGPLLRDDSDSCSDLEGYPSVGTPKHQTSCCKGSRSGMWVPAWLFLIVLIGTLVSATLLWLHIGLKQDFFLLRNHLLKVDSDSKRVPDSLREIEQHVAHLRENQSHFEEIVEQLIIKVDRLTKQIVIVNKSMEAMRPQIADVVNNQLPSNFLKLNVSLEAVQSSVTSLASDLVKTREELSSIEDSLQKQSKEAIQSCNDSISALELVLSGDETASQLSENFKMTIKKVAMEEQTQIERRLESSLKESFGEMKRQLTLTSKPTGSALIVRPASAVERAQKKPEKSKNEDNISNATVPTTTAKSLPELTTTSSSRSSSAMISSTSISALTTLPSTEKPSP